MYIGGTTLVTTTFTPAEKGIAQAVTDMTIFIIGLACSLSTGSLLQYFGWAHLNEILLPWIGLTAIALIWLALHQRKTDLLKA